MSWNAGAARLLIPELNEHMIDEVETAQYVVISKGLWKEQNNNNALEILFEDGSDAPFSIQLLANQCDRHLPHSDHRCDVDFLAYTRKGLAFKLSGKYRVVESIPCLEPWNSDRIVYNNNLH